MSTEQTDIVIMLADLQDHERTTQLLDIIGGGVVNTIEKAGAALELYSLGTGTTMEDAVAQLRESPARTSPDTPQSLAYQWLQDNRPDLF